MSLSCSKIPSVQVQGLCCPSLLWLRAFAGVSYDSSGRSVSGHLRDPILEASSSAGTKQVAEDYINLISMAEEVDNVTSKLMVDVTGV